MYRRLVAGDYAAAGLAPPISGPRAYRHLARRLLDTHGMDPLGDPEALASAEGMRISWRDGIRGCGVHVGAVLILAWDPNPRERGALITHERAHHAMWARGAPGASEADVLWLALELGLPWSERARWDTAEHVPAWMIETARCRKIEALSSVTSRRA